MSFRDFFFPPVPFYTGRKHNLELDLITCCGITVQDDGELGRANIARSGRVTVL
jgi:hypothetical protein